MKNSVRIYLMLMIAMGYSAHGQTTIQFLERSHDFGTIKEEKGDVEHKFIFINRGTQSVELLDVETSCGCTTPDWTKGSVEPSDTGYVVASFDPLNRPGRFNKTLVAKFKTASEDILKQEMDIEGEVLPKPKSIADELPTKIGGLRLKYKSLNFGRMTTKEIVTKSFDVYNDSDTVIIWSPNRIQVPKHLKVVTAPDTLRSKELGQILVSYDPVVKTDLGYVSDNLRLYTNEDQDSVKELHVIATISEYFPPLTAEEEAQAPKLSFDKTQYSFGAINEGDTVTTQFELINNGLTELAIRQVKTNCGCVNVALESKTIVPGGSIIMDVTFDSSGRQGRQYKTITVFSNDPKAPTQMVSVKAEISKSSD
ncbi:MAG: DUF1573 domain-containing protein [Cyclobacteriaceae bacterium]